MTSINKNSLYFHLLTEDYFNTYKNLDEFQEDVARGHGVMILDIKNLLIAIPLRSGISANLRNARHIFPYATYERNDGRECLKALDFSKLTIIEKKHIDYLRIYHFSDIEEKKFYLRNSNRIFSKYSTLTQNLSKQLAKCASLQIVPSLPLRQSARLTLRKN